MKKLLLLGVGVLLLVGCSSNTTHGAFTSTDKIKVVATTTMVKDLVEVIGGDKVEVVGLMQAGVDPHLYKAKESDTSTILEADLIAFNGVHLEAKLDDILSSRENIIKLENGLSENKILHDPDTDAEDPHIWFDVSVWKEAAIEVEKGLSTYDPENTGYFKANLDSYLVELDELQLYITERIEEIDPSKRILITAHDAFNYFAASNGFEVLSIQGISTQSEAATSEISSLATFITEQQIPAVFVESSISPKTIESLQDAVKSKGYVVEIGGELYSDSLKENASYIETYKINIDTIVDALKN